MHVPGVQGNAYIEFEASRALRLREEAHAAWWRPDRITNAAGGDSWLMQPCIGMARRTGFVDLVR